MCAIAPDAAARGGRTPHEATLESLKKSANLKSSEARPVAP
jgi:hypothetical protein